MILLISLFCIIPSIAAADFNEHYVGEWAKRNAEIEKALEFLPQNSPIRAELKKRRAHVANIWDSVKTLEGVQCRVMCILYNKGHGMYEVRWHSKPIARTWYSRAARFFRRNAASPMLETLA